MSAPKRVHVARGQDGTISLRSDPHANTALCETHSRHIIGMSDEDALTLIHDLLDVVYLGNSHKQRAS